MQYHLQSMYVIFFPSHLHVFISYHTQVMQSQSYTDDITLHFTLQFLSSASCQSTITSQRDRSNASLSVDINVSFNSSKTHSISIPTKLNHNSSPLLMDNSPLSTILSFLTRFKTAI